MSTFKIKLLITRIIIPYNRVNRYVIFWISSSTSATNFFSFFHSPTFSEIPFFPGAIPLGPLYISLMSISGIPLNARTWVSELVSKVTQLTANKSGGARKREDDLKIQLFIVCDTGACQHDRNQKLITKLDNN